HFQVCSPRSLGAYKYALYQIVVLPLLAQQCNILGPVFVLPIIGAYHYIDFTDNPNIIHCMLCVWILICALDMGAIVDGFNYRFRVFLSFFDERLGDKRLWITIWISAKLATAALIGVWMVPIGSRLSRTEMRKYLLEEYPNLVATFDEYRTFIVYNMDAMPDFKNGMVVLAMGPILLVLYGLFVIFAIFKFVL
ncbi:hypothetical protein PENTCL1PPCAC_5746, partial [Pristionchus entomophagus]